MRRAITHSEESYRGCVYVCVFAVETSTMRRLLRHRRTNSMWRRVKTTRICIVQYCPFCCYLLPSAVKFYQHPSNLLSNTLSPYRCLLHPCKTACRIVILYFKYLYFSLASGRTNKECKTKWQHEFSEVRVCCLRHQLVCCSAGDTVFRLMCLMSCRIRWPTHADVSNSQQVSPSGDFAEFWPLAQSDDIND